MENIAEGGAGHIKVWRVCIAYRIPKVTNTHSDCVLLVAFPQQQWWQERASMLRYTYMDCVV